MKEILRTLPKVDQLLSLETLQHYHHLLGHQVVREEARQAIESVRSALLQGASYELGELQDRVLSKLMQRLKIVAQPSLRKVINATGIVLHTNLGRAPLSGQAQQQMIEVAEGYSTLEYDPVAGKRGSRYDHVTDLLRRLTGAEDALVVNNNAAAILLALSTLADGKEAIVSRGQLIEIGGSFRIPEVMEQSGAILREVGATNRTHLPDYEKAINDCTACILKVHTSNYRIVGFTQEVETADLVALAKKHSLPLVEDLGSGVLMDLRQFGLSHEPTVPEVVLAGVDVVTFSGDKLLGGPQAGIIVGRTKYIEQMKRHPLTRAVRIDKLTLAALEATLALYLDPVLAQTQVPVLQMLAVTREELYGRAQRLCQKLHPHLSTHASAEVIPLASQVGGGALPTQDIPSYGIAITTHTLSVNEMEEALRAADTPIVARIENNQLMFDLRTVRDEDEAVIVNTLIHIWGEK